MALTKIQTCFNKAKGQKSQNQAGPKGVKWLTIYIYIIFDISIMVFLQKPYCSKEQQIILHGYLVPKNMLCFYF
jgi:hypothetical protein